MEICRKCKEELKKEDKYLNILFSLPLGFFGSGKYHLECHKKSIKNGIIFWSIIITIFIIFYIIGIVIIKTH